MLLSLHTGTKEKKRPNHNVYFIYIYIYIYIYACVCVCVCVCAHIGIHRIPYLHFHIGRMTLRLWSRQNWFGVLGQTYLLHIDHWKRCWTLSICLSSGSRGGADNLFIHPQVLFTNNTTYFGENTACVASSIIISVFVRKRLRTTPSWWCRVLCGKVGKYDVCKTRWMFWWAREFVWLRR